jgi:hypothetical protein
VPALDNPTDLVFRVTVTDGIDGASSDDVKVHVAPSTGTAPVVNAGPDRQVQGGGTVTLNGSASNTGNGPVSYLWEQIGGPVVALRNANTAQANFDAPVVQSPTDVSFRLTVTGPGGTGSDTVVVTLVPAGPVSEPPPPTPTSISSLSAFPNPYDPRDGAATLQFDLGAPSEVNVKIYDLFGRLVRELGTADDSAGGAAGRNQIHWDGRNGEGDTVGNGGYIFQVNATDAQGHSAHARGRLAVVR